MKWISVKDEWPESGTEVLTFSVENDHSYFDLACVEYDIHNNKIIWFASWCTKKLKHITHWTPLPKPPKVTNK